jgi:hypothetical protein
VSRTPPKKRLPPTTAYPADTPKPAPYRDELDPPTEELVRPIWIDRVLNLLRAGKSTMSNPSASRRDPLDSLGAADSFMDHYRAGLEACGTETPTSNSRHTSNVVYDSARPVMETTTGKPGITRVEEFGNASERPH